MIIVTIFGESWAVSTATSSVGKSQKDLEIRYFTLSSHHTSSMSINTNNHIKSPSIRATMPPIRNRGSRRHGSTAPHPYANPADQFRPVYADLKPSISRPSKLPVATTTTRRRIVLLRRVKAHCSPSHSVCNPPTIGQVERVAVGAARLEITSPDPSDVPSVSAGSFLFAPSPIILILDDVLSNLASLCPRR
jgi:hypothetical protein